jgi:hypothetical protein
MCQRCIPFGGEQDFPRIASGAHIAGAGAKRCRPHFFVSYAMRAHDRNAGEFPVQPLDLSQARGLNVDNRDIRAVAGNVDAQLIQGAGYVYGVVVNAESGSEGLCQTRLALENDDLQGLHTAPLIATVYRRWRRLWSSRRLYKRERRLPQTLQTEAATG